MSHADQIEEALKEANEQLKLAIEEERRTEEAIRSMERTYWEGKVEGLSLALLILREE